MIKGCDKLKHINFIVTTRRFFLTSDAIYILSLLISNFSTKKKNYQKSVNVRFEIDLFFVQKFEQAKHKFSIVSEIKTNLRIRLRNVKKYAFITILMIYYIKGTPYIYIYIYIYILAQCALSSNSIIVFIHHCIRIYQKIYIIVNSFSESGTSDMHRNFALSSCDQLMRDLSFN